MFRYFIVFSFLFSIIFYFIPVYEMPQVKALQYAYLYNIQTRKQSKPAALLIKNNNLPFFAIKLKKKSLTIVGPGIKEPIELPKKSLATVPFLGKGFFQYKKVGKEILYFSGAKELLWLKKYFSYPASDHAGKNLVLLTGDNNRVDLIDQGGEETPIKSISGNFMVHYAFDQTGDNKIITFSNGRVIYIHKNKSKSIMQIENEIDGGFVYAKSCALSHDGRFVAIHYTDGAKDRVKIYSITHVDKKGLVFIHAKEQEDFELSSVYAHLLHMGINEGGLFIVAPDHNIYFSLGNANHWVKKVLPNDKIYRPIFAGPDFFVIGEGKIVKVLDKDGIILYTFMLQTKERNWRVLPTNFMQSFAIQTAEFVEMWILQNQD